MLQNCRDCPCWDFEWNSCFMDNRRVPYYGRLPDCPLVEDVEPIKRGHWIGKPIAGYATVKCSNCKEVFNENNGRWLYCPHCGAKMDFEEVITNDRYKEIEK